MESKKEYWSNALKYWKNALKVSVRESVKELVRHWVKAAVMKKLEEWFIEKPMRKLMHIEEQKALLEKRKKIPNREYVF